MLTTNGAMVNVSDATSDKDWRGGVVEMERTQFITNGNMWGHPYKATAFCPDGRIRTVRLNQDADIYFSWSGRCNIGGRTVRGMVSTGSQFSEHEGELEFTPYTND